MNLSHLSNPHERQFQKKETVLPQYSYTGLLTDEESRELIEKVQRSREEYLVNPKPFEKRLGTIERKPLFEGAGIAIYAPHIQTMVPICEQGGGVVEHDEPVMLCEIHFNPGGVFYPDPKNASKYYLMMIVDLLHFSSVYKKELNDPTAPEAYFSSLTNPKMAHAVERFGMQSFGLNSPDGETDREILLAKEKLDLIIRKSVTGSEVNDEFFKSILPTPEEYTSTLRGLYGIVATDFSRQASLGLSSFEIDMLRAMLGGYQGMMMFPNEDEPSPKGVNNQLITGNIREVIQKVNEIASATVSTKEGEKSLLEALKSRLMQQKESSE